MTVDTQIKSHYDKKNDYYYYYYLGCLKLVTSKRIKWGEDYCKKEKC